MKSETFIVIFVWIICSTILNKCFTSLLLRTFYITKPSLTVETLEDIASDSELKVIGRNGLNELQEINQQIYEIIYEKIDSYSQELGLLTQRLPDLVGTTQIFDDVQERKAVLMINSEMANLIKVFYPEINLMESEHKYNQQFFYTYVSKGIPNSEQIFQM